MMLAGNIEGICKKLRLHYLTAQEKTIARSSELILGDPAQYSSWVGSIGVVRSRSLESIDWSNGRMGLRMGINADSTIMKISNE